MALNLTDPPFGPEIARFQCPKDDRHPPIAIREPTILEYAAGMIAVKQECICALTQQERQTLVDQALECFRLMRERNAQENAEQRKRWEARHGNS